MMLIPSHLSPSRIDAATITFPFDEQYLMECRSVRVSVLVRQPVTRFYPFTQPQRYRVQTRRMSAVCE